MYHFNGLSMHMDKQPACTRVFMQHTVEPLDSLGK